MWGDKQNGFNEYGRLSMKNKLGMLLVATVLIISLIVAGCAPAAAPTTAPTTAPTAAPTTTPTPAPTEEMVNWVYQAAHTSPPGTEIAQHYCDMVSDITNGRIKINFNAGGAICPATQETKAASEGILDLASTCTAYSLDVIPTGGMFSAMCGGFNIEAMGVWRDFGGGQELMEKAFSMYDVHILEAPMLNSGPEVWGFYSKELKTLKDVQGLKMRCMGDGGEILNNIGMSTIFLPGGEVYESIQRGVIDGAESAAWSGNWGAGHNEVAKYHYASTTRAATDPHQFFVNMDSWNALSAQDQMLLEAVSRANKQWSQNYMASLNVEGLQKFIDFGCVVQKLPVEIDAAFVAAAEAFYDEKAAGDPFYKEVVESIRTFRDKYMNMLALETPQV